MTAKARTKSKKKAVGKTRAKAKKKAVGKTRTRSKKEAVENEAAPKRHARARRGRGVDLERVRNVALGLPEVEEAPSYGTPGFRVKRKLFARMHQGGEDLVLRSDDDTKEALLAADPAVFHETDHYRGHPWLLLRLAAADEAILQQALRDAWAHAAPSRLVQTLEND